MMGRRSTAAQDRQGGFQREQGEAKALALPN